MFTRPRNIKSYIYNMKSGGGREGKIKSKMHHFTLLFLYQSLKVIPFLLRKFFNFLFLIYKIINLQMPVTLSILMLETWSNHHSNPLSEAILMIPKSMESDHWITKSIKIYLNIQRDVTPSILMLQTWDTHHSNPLSEAILMIPKSMKSNHWMPR